MDKDRQFQSAIECFKVINTCLRCYYNGEYHMYRPISVQLRILLCDTRYRKDNALLTRIYSNLEIQKLQAITHDQHHKRTEMGIAQMPFELSVFSSGLEIADILLDEGSLPIVEWLDQCLSIHPVPYTIRQFIRSVADTDGGAHVDAKLNALVESISKYAPTETPMDALLVIGLSRMLQPLGQVIQQLYESFGTKHSLSLGEEIFDSTHSSVQNAARIQDVSPGEQKTVYNLMSIGLTGGNL